MLIIIESALHIWCSAYMDSTNHRTKIFGKSSKKKNLNFGGIGSYLHSIYNVLRVIREDLKAEEDVHRLYANMRVCSVAQSCWTLCDPTHCSPSGSCVHGIFQARILEQVAISYSRESSWPWGRNCISASPALVGELLTTMSLGKPYVQILCHFI